MDNNTTNNYQNTVQQPVPEQQNVQGQQYYTAGQQQYAPEQIGQIPGAVYFDDKYVPEQYRKARDKKHPILEIFICLLIVAGFLLIQLVAMIPIVIIDTMDAYSKFEGTGMTTEQISEYIYNNLDTISVSIVGTVLSAIVAVLWYKLVYCRKYSFSKFKETCSRMISGGSVFGLFFAALGLFYISNLLVALIGIISPKVIEDYSDLMKSAGLENTAGFGTIFLTVVLAPINEECIMRGIIFRRLKKCMVPVAAIVLSAIYFGVFHLNIVQGVYATLLGLFMAYLAYKYDSIIPSLVFHAMFNGLNFVLPLLPDCITEDAVLGCLIPVVAGFAWYFLEGRRKIPQNS